MKNRKKLIVSIIFLLVIILIGVILAIFLLNNKEKKEDNITNKIMTLFNNSYDYFYYMYGDIKISDGFIEIDGETYYFVNEPLMTIKDFKKIVENTFVDTALETLINIDNTNKYINIDGNIYVKKIDNPCTSIKKFDFSNLKYEGNDELKEVYYDLTKTQIYNEDGTWKLGSNIYYCETEITEAEE